MNKGHMSKFPTDWNVIKLKDISNRITRKNTNEVSKNVLTISAQYGLINQEEFFNKQVASKDLSKYLLLRKGEFAYNKSYSKDYPVGAIKRLDRYKEGVLSVLYICFALDDSKYYINSDYATYLFESSILHRGISLVAKEGARNHGLLNITADDFFSINIPLPSKEEQIEIARILKDIDQYIENIDMQIQKYTQLKRALAEQLFSKNVRLKNNDGTQYPDWKVKTLGDITSKIGSGKTPRGGAAVYEDDGNYTLIRSQNVLNGVLDISDVAFISQEIFEGMKNVSLQFGDILLNITGASIGRTCIYNSELSSVVNQHVCIIRICDNDVDNYFIMQQILSSVVQNQINSYQSGGSREGLNFQQIAKIKVNIPSYQEQLKIGECLTEIDYLITEYKQQKSSYTQLKQGLMQQLLTGKIRVRVDN